MTGATPGSTTPEVLERRAMEPGTNTTTSTQPLTSVEQIEQVALPMFAERGFEETPVAAVAEAAGISRRTLFRYFRSKTDIPFGNSEAIVAELEAYLEQVPADRPMFDVIPGALVRFNQLHTDGPELHRTRLQLILGTPALRANASLRQARWMRALARYAGRHLGVDADAMPAQLVAHTAAATANVAYHQWLRDENGDLGELLIEAFSTVEHLAALDRSIAS